MLLVITLFPKKKKKNVSEKGEENVLLKWFMSE